MFPYFLSLFHLLVNGFSVIIHRAASLHHNGQFYSQLSFVWIIYIVYEMGGEKVLVKLLQLPVHVLNLFQMKSVEKLDIELYCFPMRKRYTLISPPIFGTSLVEEVSQPCLCS